MSDTAKPIKSFRSRFIFPVISIFISVMIALLIGEFAVRQLQLSKTWASYIDRDQVLQKITTEKKIGFTRIPNCEFEAPRHIIFKINSRGFRDVNHTEKNDSTKTRIAFIGDSVTEGFGVETETRFSNVFENKVNEVYHGMLETFNFGIAGYSTMDELEILKSEVLACDPHYVFLQMNLNDFSRNEDQEKYLQSGKSKSFHFENSKDFGEKSTGIIGWLQEHSALYLYIAETYNYNKLRNNISNGMTPSGASIKINQWNLTCRLLSEMDSVCRINNSTLIVSYIPLETEVLIGSDSIGNYINNKIHEFCSSKKILSLPVISELRKAENKNSLFLDNCHLSVEGNRIVAEKLSSVLLSTIHR